MNEESTWLAYRRGSAKSLLDLTGNSTNAIILLEMLTFWSPGRQIFPSIETLTILTGANARTIRRAFRAFRASGVLKSVSRHRGPGHPAIWDVPESTKVILGLRR